MKKTIRLTESDLVVLVKKVLNESNMNEQLSGIIKQFAKQGSKVKPFIKQGLRGELPLMSQLPSKVQSLIQSFPTNVKVGDKLSSLFNSHLSDIKGLKHYVKSGGGNGITETYIDGLIKLSLSLAIAASLTGQVPKVVKEMRIAQLKILKESQSSKWGRPLLFNKKND